LKLIQSRNDLPNVIQPPSFSRAKVKPSQIFSGDLAGSLDEAIAEAGVPELPQEFDILLSLVRLPSDL
jgi:hypothetical protein